jgi:hypothetical protein
VPREGLEGIDAPSKLTCGRAARGGYCGREMGRMSVKPVKPKDLLLEEVFYECLALLGVLVMTGILAVAMRVGEGKW